MSEGLWRGGGNPYDNAHVESFFKTLKHEEILANDYRTMEDVTARLPHFLEEVYNRKRLHSSLGYIPPEEFESSLKSTNWSIQRAPRVHPRRFTPRSVHFSTTVDSFYAKTRQLLRHLADC